MSTISHRPTSGTPEKRHWVEYMTTEVWASIAITAMWIAVSISAVWGPDFVSTSGSGANSTTIPSGFFVAIFASVGTWAVAKYGLGRQHKKD
jgi:hypothetical protein